MLLASTKKLKLGLTMHFSEINMLEFGKEHHTLLCILEFFTNIVDYNYLSKMRGCPQFSLWISITPVKIFFSRILINRAKISSN